MNLQSMTSPSARTLIAAAAVALTALQALSLGQLASPDTPTVMLERVQVVGQREALPSVDVAQRAAADCDGAHC
jgi:hypothetical protein